MSFLNKLWDDTLAGPPPGKLRKYNSFSAATISSTEQLPPVLPPTIKIPNPTLSADSTTPRSPPALTPPETPRGEDIKRFTRRKSVDYHRRRSLEEPHRTSPTVYDWIVITALDR